MSLVIHRRLALTALLASCLVSPALACTSSDEPNTIAPGTEDGGASDAPVIPSDDVSDDAVDASAADVDTPPRTCSLDDVCHTALPPKSFLRDV
ncbi:MAG: hypothetical protein J0I07_20375, partial [Myxococcales bacterium]|nr:hypothetical protein [Myxococcales bacterium]